MQFLPFSADERLAVRPMEVQVTLKNALQEVMDGYFEKHF
jgi:hypothetical protein